MKKLFIVVFILGSIGCLSNINATQIIIKDEAWQAIECTQNGLGTMYQVLINGKPLTVVGKPEIDVVLEHVGDPTTTHACDKKIAGVLYNLRNNGEFINSAYLLNAPLE